MSIGDDGSGWSTVDRKSKDAQQTSDTLRAGPPGVSPSRRDTPSPSQDISHPRRNTPDNSPHRKEHSSEILPPGRRNTLDVSPLRRQTASDISIPKRRNVFDIFPSASDAFPSGRIPPEDTSPPRKRKPQTDSLDMSPPRRKSSRADPIDASRPRKMTDGRQAGLITNRELAAEPLKKKQERLRDMKGGGRAAETVYRDERGKPLESLEELLRQQQGEVKLLGWGKGLAQKREVEEQNAEFEAEKVKPFACTRDDPELDKMCKEWVRWGDPMAHLVKRKDPAAELVGLRASKEMKEAGFILPQGIPQTSWLERGVEAPMNRYRIKPGCHWDGKDRSTGFESQVFKAKAEKQATDMEAYLCSVSISSRMDRIRERIQVSFQMPGLQQSTNSMAPLTSKPKVDRLQSRVLRWTTNDITNPTLFKNQMQDIQMKFPSTSEYLRAFRVPLLEEVRTQAHQALEKSNEEGDYLVTKLTAKGAQNQYPSMRKYIMSLSLHGKTPVSDLWTTSPCVVAIFHGGTPDGSA